MSSAAQYDYRYIHSLLLDTGTGIMDNVIPHCPYTYKAKSSNDPDTPNIGQALTGVYRVEFLEAMRKEITELEGYSTWTIIGRNSLPEGANVLPSTWAFKIKRYPDGRLRKFKARFCVRGDKQVEGIDYDDKYAPVVSWSTVRMMMRISLQQGWKTRQVDFANAFVQSKINEDVYITLPPGFGSSCSDNEKLVMKLNKSLYGLVQAPLYWFNTLKAGLERHGFKQSKYDSCLFYGKDMVALVYVDDVIFFGPCQNKIDKVLDQLESDGFAMTREKDLFHFLGVDIADGKDGKRCTIQQKELI